MNRLRPARRSGIVLGLFLIFVLMIVGSMLYIRWFYAVRSNPCQINHLTYCALNPAVTQTTIYRTICVSGWTSKIRPPTSYTEPIKKRLLAQSQNLHGSDNKISDYELDHRVPLELGGDPRSLNNLSLEFGIPNPKDKDENAFKRLVCAGESLLQAQTEFIAKWLAPYPRYNGGS